VADFTFPTARLTLTLKVKYRSKEYERTNQMMQVRVATDLEIKHFEELIAPISLLVADNDDRKPELAPAHLAMARNVMAELDRFGYIPHPMRLLVRLDLSCLDLTLTDEHDEVVMADMSDLYGKLGIRTV
jgi:hypothetical protein